MQDLCSSLLRSEIKEIIPSGLRREARGFLLAAVLVSFLLSLANLRAQSIEQYATTDTGVALRWSVYAPADGGQHPAVIVIHPGGFKSGFPGPKNVAKDLARAGFVAFAAEYRLAPPHVHSVISPGFGRFGKLVRFRQSDDQTLVLTVRPRLSAIQAQGK